MNAATAATAAVLVVVLAACTSTGPPSAPAPVNSGNTNRAQAAVAPTFPTAATADQKPATAVVPPRVPGLVNKADPSSVALAVVATTNQFDTRTDTSRLDALRRAQLWLTPALLSGSLAVPQRPDAAWTTLVTHRGYTTVDHLELANEYGQPPNTAAVHYAQISYQTHETGRDGWRSADSGPQLARIRLINTGTGWQVNGFA